MVADETVRVGTARGSIEILQLQPEGKGEMSAAEFVRGYRPKTGDVFRAP